MKKRELLTYIENLEKRVADLQHRVHALEAKAGYIPAPIGNNSHTWTRPDCGCPPGNNCGSTACPRAPQITCQAVG